MQTRRLGNTDLILTTVGLGTWAMGGPRQILETVDASDWTLSRADIDEIERLLKERQKKLPGTA